MPILFYRFATTAYFRVIRLMALFSDKAKKWVDGRHQVFTWLEQNIQHNQPIIWIHCASLGEFEQGLPLIEALKNQYPTYQIAVSFFSPSGYEVHKKNPALDYVFYLPTDSPTNAARFYQILQPKLVLFIKYEFWYFFLKKAAALSIPTLLVSAQFRPSQIFFKWYGGFYKKMLHCFTHIFVQHAAAHALLKTIDLPNKKYSIAGDTRFDRVQTIASQPHPLPIIESFIKNTSVLVAGSTWPKDESLLLPIVQQIDNLKIIVAPHEINHRRIEHLLLLHPQAIRYSTASSQPNWSQYNILIIDTMGLLSTIYRYANVAYIGGGFGAKGIHNILEAAVHQKPLFFGPCFQKFQEAIDLVTTQGAVSVSNATQAQQQLRSFLTNPQPAALINYNYVLQNAGATQHIMQFIKTHQLL